MAGVEEVCEADVVFDELLVDELVAHTDQAGSSEVVEVFTAGLLDVVVDHSDQV